MDFLLITLWALFAIMLIYFLQGKKLIVQGKYFFTERTQFAPWFKNLKKSRWFQPGVVVGLLSPVERYNKLIPESGQKVKVEDIQAMKQGVVLITEIIFWVFLFFGFWTLKTLFWFLVVMLLLFYAPDVWLKGEREKRKKTFEKEVLYFIDMLSMSLETGMNLEQALESTAENMHLQLAEEIQLQQQYMNFGMSLDTVLQELKKRIPVEEFQRFMSNLLQARQLGVSLAQTLKTQSAYIKAKNRQKAEELSKTASVKISIPLVVFIFPALLIIYLGPPLAQFLGS